MADFTYQQYQKIEAATTALTTLMKEANRFGSVMRGYPEDFNKLQKGTIAGAYFSNMTFDETHGARSKPDFIRHVLWITAKGTKTAVHDFIKSNSLYIASRFDSKEGDEDWITLNGNVRNTFLEDFRIIPEQTQSKKALLTTAIITLRHDVRW